MDRVLISLLKLSLPVNHVTGFCQKMLPLPPGRSSGMHLCPYDACLASKGTWRAARGSAHSRALGPVYHSAGMHSKPPFCVLRTPQSDVKVSCSVLTHTQEGPYLSGTSPCAQCLSTAPKVYHLSIATKEIKVTAPTVLS